MTPEGSTRIVKRSLVVAGHRTSVSLEEAFWRRLKRIAAD
jgi:predicted DNA-binding ribbon-helix-helix protein